MNKTAIEWCNYTINPVKGKCPVACSYCYARRLYDRFKWNPEIRYDNSYVPDLANIRKPSRVFVGSTMELFGEWVDPEWMRDIFRWCGFYSQHTFIFLTKQPQNLPKEFPDNCWVGVSATNYQQYALGLLYLTDVRAQVKFISFEPLLSQITDKNTQYNAEMMSYDFKFTGINWLIIGQQTPSSPKTAPKIEWVREIVEATDKAYVPVFLKNNLKDFIYGEYGGKYKQVFKYARDGGRELRQEFPIAK